MKALNGALPCLVVAILAAAGLVRIGSSRRSEAQVVVSLAPSARPPRELPQPDARTATSGGAPANAQRERPMRNVARDSQLGALNWTSPDKGAIVFCTQPRSAPRVVARARTPSHTRR